VKYRKKPVVIEATQFLGDGHAPDPEGVCRCAPDDLLYRGVSEAGPHVHTLEGWLTVTAHDWIITGVKGERYPCKPDVFEATYEPVEDA
jgi:hypothetical protein